MGKKSSTIIPSNTANFKDDKGGVTIFSSIIRSLVVCVCMCICVCVCVCVRARAFESVEVRRQTYGMDGVDYPSFLVLDLCHRDYIEHFLAVPPP